MTHPRPSHTCGPAREKRSVLLIWQNTDAFSTNNDCLDELLLKSWKWRNRCQPTFGYHCLCLDELNNLELVWLSYVAASECLGERQSVHHTWIRNIKLALNPKYNKSSTAVLASTRPIKLCMSYIKQSKTHREKYDIKISSVLVGLMRAPTPAFISISN
jgi:hypothetical protein